jgi:hypothetical protein
MAENTGKEAAAVVVVTGAAAPAVVSNANYIALAIQAKQQGFLEANEGLDLDYVRMGQYLKISKKGNFVEARDETVCYGETRRLVFTLCLSRRAIRTASETTLWESTTVKLKLSAYQQLPGQTK